MDQDGANVRYLTRGDDLVLTPRFSSTADTITYMSYSQGDPKVYLMNIETGQREIVGNFPGMSFSPRFSPDSQRVIFSLQRLPRFWTILDSIYARARVNVNLELSRSGNGVRDGFRRPDGPAW
jgi:hypothetical protein